MASYLQIDDLTKSSFSENYNNLRGTGAAAFATHAAAYIQAGITSLSMTDNS